ncbi:protein DDI1 homolog 2-like [Styela clava]|uniref:protein DDI1 homolog 2-like n=1 Tax=Styela clava TaxID=7725 RepID=UPI0019396847|nr:protein DDI1 homolog 2-like [Styela clava]
MKVTIVCLEKDHTISLDVQSDFSLENFRALCSDELKIASDTILLVHNGIPLIDLTKTLSSYGVQDSDMILVQNIPSSAQRQLNQPTRPPGMPNIDFSAIRFPGQPSTSRQTVPPPRQTAPDILSNPEALRQRFLNSSHDMALLRERNPEFAEAISKGGDAYLKQLEKMRETHAQNERDKIRMLNADILDPEIQNKIAEEIRQQNIQENMNMAIEEAPESFGQVVMLWINVKVNGHSVKAFVDSGAQMTIMSAKCAENCHIMRLVDRRWEGIAKGVGTQKIIGRIHLAQMQIENDFLQCSFSVLEDQPMDVLLGLDMLRRHQCCIDLKDNKLRIGTTGTETSFLHESELPTHGRLHDPNAAETSNLTEDERIAKAVQESTDEAIRHNKTREDIPSINFPGAGRTLGATSSQQGDSVNMVSESDLKKVMDVGVTREIAEKMLRECDGDAQRAIIKLLARSLKPK